MPIRPKNRQRYPEDWDRISFYIRFVRANGRCECDARCGSRLHRSGRCEAYHNQPHPRTGSIVVLTVAHLDHTPENCDETNLMAMCQACHLAYDRDHHAETAAQTARERAAAAGQQTLWGTP